MANNEEEKPVNKLLALVAAVILGGAGGSLGSRVAHDPRPDPFTGTDARVMQADILRQSKDSDTELQRRLGRLESRIQIMERTNEQWKLKVQSSEDKIEYHMRSHP